MKRFLCLISLFLAFASCLCNAQTKQSKAQLKEENSALKAKLDSMMTVLGNCQEQLTATQEELDKANALLVIEAHEDSPISREFSDSLLTHWYMCGFEEGEDVELENVDSVVYSSDVPDSVYIQRIKDMNCYIQIAYNEIVRNYIILYSQRYRKWIGNILGQCDFYLPIFKETFNRYNLPEELAVMAIIESHLNPTATSRAGAKGMWQFMYPTAKKYGLTINSFVDERMDVAKSADAAARYLRDAYRIFGDWNLAISSYNCGAGNVKKAMVRSGGKTGFWDIYPYLPRETRGYVPAFVGALYTLTYHKEHGIVAQPSDMPVHVDTFHINKMLHFQQIKEVVGVPEEDIRKLNPQYCHDIIPGNKGDYVLRLPHIYTDAFIENEDTLYRHKADTLFSPMTIKKIEDGAVGNGARTVYTVKSGDTLGAIARRYHTSVASIQKWNGMRNTNLRIGQKLYIYR